MGRAFFALCVAACLALAATPACARKLYAASAHDDPVAGESTGYLYVVNPASGHSRQIGAIRIGGTVPVAVDGLAVHPKTGVLYGITTGSSHEPSLITINPRSAEARLVGALGGRGSDIHFGTDGMLYIWLQDSARLGVVNIETGKVTPIGKAGAAASGGLAINSQGLALVAARMSKGIVDTMDPKTGAVVGGLQLIDSSVLNAVMALEMSSAGAIFAVNTVKGTKSKRELVSIDTESGAVTKVGSLPDEVDALAFSLDNHDTPRSKIPLLVMMVALFVALHLLGMLRWRKSG